jgi:hypothetical protein
MIANLKSQCHPSAKRFSQIERSKFTGIEVGVS